MVCTWAIAGFTGAGKTFALNYIKELDLYNKIFDDYIDLDLYIEEHFEHPRLYIQKNGFLEFRKLEQKCLIDLLQKKMKFLIALGGGALNESVYKYLKNKKVQILGINADFQACFNRFEHDQDRPISELNHQQILNLFQERKKVWAKSDYILDNNGDLAFFKKALKSWYSCQQALNG